MDFDKILEDVFTNPGAAAALGGAGVNPLPALAAEPLIKEDIRATREGLYFLRDRLKQEPYRMNTEYRGYLEMITALVANTHPLLSVGKERTAQWEEAADEYEALSGGACPLAVRITKESAHTVSHLIPREYLDLIENENRYILAAMRYMPSEEERAVYREYVRKTLTAYINETGDETDDSAFAGVQNAGDLVPAGVLSFVLDYDEGTPIARVEWLYVAPEHRNRRLADLLMTRMLSMLSDYAPEAIIANIDQDHISGSGEPRPRFDPDLEPVLLELGFQEDEDEEDYDPEKDFPPLVHFLVKWKFAIQYRTEDEAFFKISDLKLPENARKKTKEPEPIKGLDENKLRAAMRKFIEKQPERYDSQLSETDMSRFDPDISVFTAEGGEVDGLLLARKNHMGYIVFDMFCTKDGLEDSMMDLLSCVKGLITEKYGEDAVVCTPFHQELELKLFEDCVPSLKYRLNAAAVMIKPSADVTTEEWDSFVEALQELSPEDMQELSRELSARDMDLYTQDFGEDSLFSLQK